MIRHWVIEVGIAIAEKKKVRSNLSAIRLRTLGAYLNPTGK
jgi:hypothetical protein